MCLEHFSLGFIGGRYLHEQREMFQTHALFTRENYIYEVVLPYFREFQRSRGVHHNGFDEYSKCYKTIVTEPNECIILQDMGQDNFIMTDKKDVSVEHILLVMKTLGKFHALSLASKDQEPEKFDELVNNIDEVMFRHGDTSEFPVQVNNAAKVAIDCITDDNDAHLLQAILKLYETSQFDQLADLVDENESEPYSVIVHGDMWSNNTMFKYDENDNTLQNICFIDWQIVRYGSPVLDLTYYLFSATTKETRGRNYNIYLKTYHESLSNLLRRLGSDPEKLFPFSALQEQLKKFGKYGLLSAALVLPVILAERDISEQYQREQTNEAKTTQGLSEEFKKRFRDMICDAYRLGNI